MKTSDSEDKVRDDANTPTIIQGRRTFIKSIGAISAVASLPGVSGAQDGDSQDTDELSYIETTVAEIRSAQIAGRMSAEEITQHYLDRIETYDDELNSIITVNPEAAERAQELDDELEDSGPVGPLHGVPILLKDIVDTDDMPTTGGNVLFEDTVPEDDAFITTQLQDAGGIILGKANLGELAWGSLSSLGGQVHNPYNLEREPGGSSAGTGAAIGANLSAIGIGTDTGGSVRIPAGHNALVGLRPTTGLVSRDGIIPLSETQDTAGPMTRTVTDTAIMLDAMAGYDPADSETARTHNEIPEDGYTAALDVDGLEGKCIGVIQEYMTPDSEESDPRGEPDAVTAVIETALDDLEEAGATVVDSGISDIGPLVDEAGVITYEVERDFNNYLESLGDDAPVDSLQELVDSGTIEGEVLENAFIEGVEVDSDELDENVDYLQALRARQDVQETVLAAMVENDLDALVYPMSNRIAQKIGSDQPGGYNTGLAPVIGFPAITVPAGFTPESEFPVGIEFMADQFEESTLFEIGYSFEQATMYRQPPDGFGPL